MFNWYNKNAPKNTITRYLSTMYTPEQLNKLTILELPDNFESTDYAKELNYILTNSPWKEVKYQTPSLTNLKGIFNKDYWFGKKKLPKEEAGSKEEDLKVHYHPNPYDNLYQEDDWKDIHPNFTVMLQEQWEDENFTYQQTKEWIDIGLSPQDAEFCAWLQEQGYTALAVLNDGDTKNLRNEYEQSLLKKPLFDWYSEGKLSFTEFSQLASQVPSKSANYSWSELNHLLTNYQPQRANYPISKLILLITGTSLVLYLLTN